MSKVLLAGRPIERVAVAGGSIAGLTAASLLRDDGFDVDVYERSGAPLSGLGTGIVVQPELVRYLIERTPTTLGDISVPSTAMHYVRADTGAVVGEIDLGWHFTSYNAVYHRLLGAFDRGRYHLGHLLTGVTQTPDQATLHFLDQQPVQADLAVCADGGMSLARRQLTGVAPSYAGYVTWRGVAELPDLSSETREFFDGYFTYGLLDDGHLIAYPIPVVDVDGRLRRGLNFQWYWNVPEGPELDALMTARDGGRRRTTVHHEDLRPEALADFRRAAERRLVAPFAELLQKTATPFVTIIADAAVEQMRHGRFVLIGDAAVTPRPHAAAGGAKAADDAWTLVRALAQDDVAAALDDWDRQQLAIGRAYLCKVRRMADALQHGGEFCPGDPANRFGLPRLAA